MAAKPIIGIRAKGPEVHSFREVKLDLKARGYPKEETKAFVQEYFSKIKHLVREQVDHKTLLIEVPSGSGTNKVTRFFAMEISQLTGASILPSEFNLVRKLHRGEAKNNLSLEKRNADPIGYDVKGSEIKELAKGYSKILVLDDLIGSGESSIKLVKVLERAGVRIDGMLNLVTVEKSYPTPNDFNRVHKKIKDHAKLVLSDSMKLSKNLKIVFSDYTRQKLNRFERPINNERTAVAAFKNLSKAAAIENKYNKGRGEILSL